MELVGSENVANMIVAGKVVQCLLDTGSMVTTISEVYYNCCLKDDYPLLSLKTLIKIEGAGGHNLPYLGYVELEMGIGNCDKTVFVPVLVVPSTNYSEQVPMIVGTNVLNALQEKGVSSHSSAWKAAIQSLVNGNDRQFEDVAVYCTSAIEIQPRQSLVISGRVGAQREYSSGILEPVDVLPGGVVMPVCAVTVYEKQRVYLKLTNLSSHVVQIPKRQRIATMLHARLLESTVCCSVQNKTAEGPVRDVPKTRVDVDLDGTILKRGRRRKYIDY